MDLFTRKVNVTPRSVTRVPWMNAFSNYSSIRDGLRPIIQEDAVVAIFAGPLGRILAVDTHLLHRSAVILELGSFFDPYFGLDYGASYNRGVGQIKAISDEC